MEINVTLDRMVNFYGIPTHYRLLDGAYLIRHICPGEVAAIPNLLIAPSFRCEGAFLVIMKRGHATIEMDGNEFSAGPNSVYFMPPKVSSKISSTEWGDIEAWMLFMSIEFLQNLNFSTSMVFQGPSLLEDRSPVITLSDSQIATAETYFHLLEENARSGEHARFRRQVAANLCVACLYQIIEFKLGKLEQDDNPAQGRVLSPHIRAFLRLVHENYTRERSVGFYASQLCVSPKYLSSLVKAATGRTAARWIDDYVIMEAKNLLRFSGKNIQQVAYDLNFPNQSAFGKYFKHITGLSPTQFQKS